MNIPLNPLTKRNVDYFLSSPTHSLILEGPAGAGKQLIALHIAASLLRISSDKITAHPFFTHVTPEDKSITIEQVRNLKQLLRLQVPGSDPVRRIILLDHAETMTDEAQNAFLKILEEPPRDTVLILSVTSTNRLLPTVVSRAPVYRVLPVPIEQAMVHYTKEGKSEAAVKRAYHMSDGYIGLMDALLNEQNVHSLVAAIEQAKKLLAASTFERLTQVDSYAKNKDAISDLLFALERICHSALIASTERQNSAHSIRWQKSLQAVLDAQKNHAKNASSKLMLTNLFLNV